MKKTSMKLIIFLISIILINIPLEYFNNTSAESGNSFPYQPTDEVIVIALDYLNSRQARDGSIGCFTVSAWAAMAISAAEEDPHNWGNLVDYLVNNVDRLDKNKATDWERHTLAIVACNEDPRDFGGFDFIDKIIGFYDGMQIAEIANLYDDFFGILALIAGGVEKDSSIIKNVRSYIKEQQHKNGKWGDVDSTSAAIMALISAGESPHSECISNALSYLKTTQKENGGFQSWGTGNAASTAWAVNAIVAAGQNPTNIKWRCGDNSPIDFLLNLQQKNGCFNWSDNKNMNPEWMTSYVIPALLGKPYPVKIFKSDGGGNNSGNENNGDNDGGDDNGDEGKWQGFIRIEGASHTIWNGEVCFSDSLITALNDSSGEMEDYYIPFPSVLGALDEASQEGGFSYFVIYYPSWNAFFIKTIADDSDWWHYWVDYTLPMVGAGAYELTEEDDEILWGYLENWTAHALRISVSKNIVNVSEEFVVRVYNATMSPVKDAVVYVNSFEYITDENGNVLIDIDIPGNYEIYAEKEGYVRSNRTSVQVLLLVEIIKPEDKAVYLLNRKTRISYSDILIIGHIDIEVNTADNVEKVEFYINNKLKYADYEHPFIWRLNERALYENKTIKVQAYVSNNDSLLYIKQLIEHVVSLVEKYSSPYIINKIITYMQNLEDIITTQSTVAEKEVRIINIFPNLHIL